ncbi:menaquinone biosynthesis protein [Nocardia sp. NPDC020380]|uniref:menaquinone biosynthesis protein n=1 Tax=Nocardia sp. NPDC020380 TaxID=3364309 RepID=UPI0037AADB5F
MRLGNFSFLNCVPVRWGLAHTNSHEKLELTSGTPTALAADLLAGRIDVGPVSLVEYLQNTDSLELLPGGFSISSHGPILSCHLVSRTESAGLDGAVVALSNGSRTTTLMAQLLLEDVMGVEPVYRSAPQNLSRMLAAADAAVIIGDEALQLYDTSPADLQMMDIGESWHRWTGLPTVFAVWVVRREFKSANPGQVSAAAEILRNAFELAGAHPESVIDQACAESARNPAGRVSEQTLREYYKTIDYSLGEQQLAAISEFAHLARGRFER